MPSDRPLSLFSTYHQWRGKTRNHSRRKREVMGFIWRGACCYKSQRAVSIVMVGVMRF